MTKNQGQGFVRIKCNYSLTNPCLNHENPATKRTNINQGGKFYEKFKIILNSYENAKQCETKLPLEYKKLKADIDVAINKFNVAYKPVEVNGTKMKEILYGLNEFD